MTWIKPFLDSLKIVATSPYAFVAYVCVFAGWVYIVISQGRLKAIQKLPAGDQATILEKEYRVLPRSGLSGEQWIRSRRHTLTFWAFVIAIVAAVLLSTIAMLNVKPVTAQSEPTTAATIEVARSSVQEPKQTAKLSVDLYLFAKDKMAYYSNTRVTSVVTIMTDKGKTVESREVASRLTAEGRTVFELPYGDYLITIDREGKHFQKKITLASPDTHIIFDFPQGLIQKVN